MQYYASHYLWHAGQDKLFRMQRIGLEVSGHTWVSMEPLEEEVRNTQWLGGLIILAGFCSGIKERRNISGISCADGFCSGRRPAALCFPCVVF